MNESKGWQEPGDTDDGPVPIPQADGSAVTCNGCNQALDPDGDCVNPNCENSIFFDDELDDEDDFDDDTDEDE